MKTISERRTFLTTHLTIVVVAIFLLSTGVCVAQESRAAIAGTISDSSGAVIPGATVTVTNAGTNVSIAAATNERGKYHVPYLIPGAYRISAEAKGFRRFVRVSVHRGRAGSAFPNPPYDQSDELGGFRFPPVTTSGRTRLVLRPWWPRCLARRDRGKEERGS